MLASLILTVHVAVIAFNLFGLIAIPLGAWRGWAFVHAPLWRLAHVASLAVVALQALLGRACFLTVWQNDLTEASEEPLIMRWVNAIIFWPLPFWAFAVVYVAVFLRTLALLRIVPLHPIRR